MRKSGLKSSFLGKSSKSQESNSAVENSIHYLMVAHGDSILADYSSQKGNFREFIRTIIKYFKRGRYILMYKENEVVYIKEKADQGLMFLMIADDSIQAMKTLVCLERIRKDFLAQFDLVEVSGFKSFSLNKKFEKTMERHRVG